MTTSATRHEPPTAGAGRRAVRVYYGGLSVLLLATLIAQCVLTVSQGRSLVNTFSYFTVQSNVLVLITSAILAVDPSVHGAWWRVLRTAALAGITVTGVVFATVLARTSTVTGIGVLYSVVFHYIVPTATIVGFVFIGPRLQLWMADLAFMVWPILWIVYTLIRGGPGRPGVHLVQPRHQPLPLRLFGRRSLTAAQRGAVPHRRRCRASGRRAGVHHG